MLLAGARRHGGRLPIDLALGARPPRTASFLIFSAATVLATVAALMVVACRSSSSESPPPATSYGSVVPLAPPPQVVGTASLQTRVQKSFTLLCTTVAGGSCVVDTGYAPPLAHAAKVDGNVVCTDRDAGTVQGKNINAAVRKYGDAGLAVAGSPVVSGATGDSVGFGLTFGVSGGGTLQATFTAPFVDGGTYAGTLDCEADITVTED